MSILFRLFLLHFFSLLLLLHLSLLLLLCLFLLLFFLLFHLFSLFLSLLLLFSHSLLSLLLFHKLSHFSQAQLHTFRFFRYSYPSHSITLSYQYASSDSISPSHLIMASLFGFHKIVLFSGIILIATISFNSYRIMIRT